MVDRPFASTPLAITDTVSPATVAIKVPTPSRALPADQVALRSFAAALGLMGLRLALADR